MDVEIWDGGLFEFELDAIRKMQKAFVPQAATGRAQQKKMASFAELKRASDSEGMWPWKGYAGFQFLDSRAGDGEYDLILVTHDRIIIVELKHWSGKIERREYKWFQNGIDRGRSPVLVNRDKVVKLASRLKKLEQRGKLPKRSTPYVEHRVVLTKNNNISQLGEDQQYVMTLDSFLKIANPASYKKEFTHNAWTQPNKLITEFDNYFLDRESTKARDLIIDGYRASEEVFAHPDKAYVEYKAVDDRDKNAAVLLRRWNFGKLDIHTQSERYKVVSREKRVLNHLKQQTDELSNHCLTALSNPQEGDIGLDYCELYDLPSRQDRLNEFINSYLQKLKEPDRIALVKILLLRFAELHEAGVAHRDIGDHSLWLGQASKVSISSFVSAYYPETETVGGLRKLLSVNHVQLPEDEDGMTDRNVTPFHRDVYMLGICASHLLSGQPLGEMDWVEQRELIEQSQGWYGYWLKKATEPAPSDRYKNAREMLEELNDLSPKDSQVNLYDDTFFEEFRKDIIPYMQYPMVEQIKTHGVCQVYRSNNDQIVKIWSGVHLSESNQQHSGQARMFLERAKLLNELSLDYVPGFTDFGLSNTTASLYVVMEDVQGEKWLDKAGSTLGKDERLNMAGTLLNAVQNFHNADLWHGDLHPDNLLVIKKDDGFGVVLLDVLDFRTDEEEAHNYAYSPANYAHCTAHVRDNFAVYRLIADMLKIDWENPESSEHPEITEAIVAERQEQDGYLNLSRIKDAVHNELNPPPEVPVFTLSVAGRQFEEETSIHADNGQIYLIVQEDRKSKDNMVVNVAGVGGEILLIINKREKKIIGGSKRELNLNLVRRRCTARWEASLKIKPAREWCCEELLEFVWELDETKAILAQMPKFEEEKVTQAVTRTLGYEIPEGFSQRLEKVREAVGNKRPYPLLVVGGEDRARNDVIISLAKKYGCSFFVGPWVNGVLSKDYAAKAVRRTLMLQRKIRGVSFTGRTDQALWDDKKEIDKIQWEMKRCQSVIDYPPKAVVMLNTAESVSVLSDIRKSGIPCFRPEDLNNFGASGVTLEDRLKGLLDALTVPLREIEVAPEEKTEEPVAQESPEEESYLSKVTTKTLWKAIVEEEQEATLPKVEVASEPKLIAGGDRLELKYTSEGDVVGNYEPTDRVKVFRKFQNDLRFVGKLEVNRSGHGVMWLTSLGFGTPSPGETLFLESSRDRSSFFRRKTALDRILGRESVIRELPDYFDPNLDIKPLRLSSPPSESVLDSYDREKDDGKVIRLNDEQRKAFKKLLEYGPVSLLQGPPGTGKTEFIAAFIHNLIYREGAKHILLVSQSHEAVNNAVERIRDHCDDSGTELDVVRFSNNEGSVSENLQDVFAPAVREEKRNRFDAEFTSRVKGLARALKVSEDFLKELVELDVHIVRKGQGIIKLAQDLATDDFDSEQRAINKGRIEAMTAELEELVRTVYRISDYQFTESDFDNFVTELQNKVARKSGVMSADLINRSKQLIELSRDWVTTLGSEFVNYDEFLARSRTLVCGTCVGVGLKHIGIAANQYDWVIIDEAARSSPSELAVAMQSGKRIMLVGDHAQLPPTYDAEHKEAIASSLKLKESDIDRILVSDFQRSFDSSYGSKVGARLLTQYRMTPSIGNLVSDCFYDGDLKTGRGGSPDAYQFAPDIISSYVTWVDTSDLGYHEETPAKGLYHPKEIDQIIAVLKLIEASEEFVEAIDTDSNEQSIGVICMYKEQKKRLQARFFEESWSERFKEMVKIDTVDSYQGKENQIVIVAITRNPRNRTPGFLRLPNRINVAMSRAMERLVIVGALQLWSGQNAETPFGKVAGYIQKRQDEKNYRFLPATVKTSQRGQR